MTIRTALKKSQTLISNVGWLTGAELGARITRIAATVLLARFLSPIDFGIAAIAITVFELVRIFNENGIGAAIIRASDEEVAALSKAAYRLGWIICVSLAVVQTLAGLVVAQITGEPRIAWMVAALSGVYFLMPLGLVHCWLLQRQQRLRRIAAVNTIQISTDNVLTAILALTGFGPWAIVLPKLLTAPIWVLGVRWGRPWRPEARTLPAPIIPFVRFGLPIVATEALGALRVHADKFIIGAVFGLEALGLYYFAFNAGLGLSGSLNNAFRSAIYPHLCNDVRNGLDIGRSIDRSLVMVGLPLVGAFLAQAALVPLYVPIVFGDQWAVAVPLVVALCLAGPGRLFSDAGAMMLRASGHVVRETVQTLLLAFSALGALLTLSQFGLFGSAIGYSTVTVLGGLLFFIAARFNPSNPSPDIPRKRFPNELRT